MYINRGLHQIHVQEHGRKDGFPVIFLHGGPGLGCTESDARFFDLSKTRVLLIDQRGCGQSKPSRCVEENTTADLVEDIRVVLEYFDIPKAVLFGGSWGSALALCFAIKYPHQVSALVLRGVFTGSLSDRFFLEHGGSEELRPRGWHQFRDLVPSTHQQHAHDFYMQKILTGTVAEQEQFARALTIYGHTNAYDDVPSEQELQTALSQSDYITRAIIFAHYTQHDFFLPDNYVLNHLDAIQDIPCYIVHGRNDLICLPNISENLAQKLPNAHLHLVEGGHAASEKLIEQTLCQIMESLSSL